MGIFLGVFLEGEMIMISSVIAAHHHYLNLWAVVVIGVVATFASDTLYFHLGRTKGQEWLNKRPSWQNKARILDGKIKKYPFLIFITYRFLYGFRTVAPFVIGTSRIKTSSFYLFCAISTSIWALTYCTIGYLFGELIKTKLSHIEHIEKYIIGVIALVGIIIIVLRRQSRKRN